VPTASAKSIGIGTQTLPSVADYRRIAKRYEDLEHRASEMKGCNALPRPVVAPVTYL
jgi:hypothetical protein